MWPILGPPWAPTPPAAPLCSELGLMGTADCLHPAAVALPLTAPASEKRRRHGPWPTRRTSWQGPNVQLKRVRPMALHKGSRRPDASWTISPLSGWKTTLHPAATMRETLTSGFTTAATWKGIPHWCPSPSLKCAIIWPKFSIGVPLAALN